MSSAESAGRFLESYARRTRAARNDRRSLVGRRPVDPRKPHEYAPVTRTRCGQVQHSWSCSCGGNATRWWLDTADAVWAHRQHRARMERAALFIDRVEPCRVELWTSAGRLVDEHW